MTILQTTIFFSQKIKFSGRSIYAVNLVSGDDLQKVRKKALEALNEY
jgi:hypothetical protein